MLKPSPDYTSTRQGVRGLRRRSLKSLDVSRSAALWRQFWRGWRPRSWSKKGAALLGFCQSVRAGSRSLIAYC